MVKQFFARRVKVVASGTIRSNYIIDYIRKIKVLKSLRFYPHSLGEHGWCSGENVRFWFWPGAICEGWRS